MSNTRAATEGIEFMDRPCVVEKIDFVSRLGNMGAGMKLQISVNVNPRHRCICTIYRNCISGENACHRALDNMMEI